MITWKHETDRVIPLSKNELLAWPSNGPKMIFVSLFQIIDPWVNILKTYPGISCSEQLILFFQKCSKAVFILMSIPKDQVSRFQFMQELISWPWRKSHPHLLIGLCVLYEFPALFDHVIVQQGEPKIISDITGFRS